MPPRLLYLVRFLFREKLHAGVVLVLEPVRKTDRFHQFVFRNRGGQLVLVDSGCAMRLRVGSGRCLELTRVLVSPLLLEFLSFLYAANRGNHAAAAQNSVSHAS